MNQKIIGSNGAEFQVRHVTPEMAATWLSTGNTHNRKLRQRTVDGYATDMTAGDWTLAGDPIRIAADGTIVDGQHRLTAIVQSNQTVEMLVATNVPMQTQEVIDSGVKRTFADNLRQAGVPNCNTVAATTRRALLWDNGSYSHLNKRIETSHRMLAKYLDEHPEIHESARRANGHNDQIPMAASLLGFIDFLFMRIDTFDAAGFFHMASKDTDLDGNGLPEGHPIKTLRRALWNNVRSTSKLDADHLIGYNIKAWNAFRKGQELKILRLSLGGSSPEKFPLPE